MSKEDILGGVKMSGFFRSMAFKKCMLILIWGVTLFAVGFGISFYRGVGKKYDLVQEVPIKEISVEGHFGDIQPGHAFQPPKILAGTHAGLFFQCHLRHKGFQIAGHRISSLFLIGPSGPRKNCIIQD